MGNPNAIMWFQRMIVLIGVCIALVAVVQVRNMGMPSVAAAPAEPENAARIRYVWATPTPPPDYATKIELGYGQHILWTNLKDQSAREIWVNQPLAGNPPEVTFAPFGSAQGGVVLIMSPTDDPMLWTAAPNIDEQLWFGIIKVILFSDHVRIESTDGAFAIAPAMPTPVTIIQEVPVYIRANPAP